MRQKKTHPKFANTEDIFLLKKNDGTWVYLAKLGVIKINSSGGIFEPTNWGFFTISTAMKPGIAERTPYLGAERGKESPKNERDL